MKRQNKPQRSVQDIYDDFRAITLTREEFAILDAPHRRGRPVLLFIGEQPGSAHPGVGPQPAMRSPPAVSNLTDDVHRYCIFVQWLFWRANELPTLKRSQGIDWFFYRKNVEISPKRKKRLKAKCADAVDELIDILNPHRLVFVGQTSAKIARKRAGVSPPNCDCLFEFEYKSRKAICLPHFSLRNANYDQIKATIPAIKKFSRGAKNSKRGR